MPNSGGKFGPENIQVHSLWLQQKILLDERPHPTFYFYEREIWWASLGKNIGHEIDGKNKEFSRPVLVLKRYSSTMALVLPLTTQLKPDKQFQFQIIVNNELMAILLEQPKTISSKRFSKKITKIDLQIFVNILRQFFTHII